MAKLKGPLLSFGASGAIGKTVVFFNWKGIDVAREYVVPTNPQSTDQNTQRGYMTTAVSVVHTVQALATHALAEIDTIAYALLGSTFPSPRTWFNQMVKNWIDQYVAGLKGVYFHGFVLTPGASKVTVYGWLTSGGANNVTAGDIWYGTSKTALVNHLSCTQAELNAGMDVPGLTTGTKYFFQYRPTAHADFVGCNSGIYNAVAA